MSITCPPTVTGCNATWFSAEYIGQIKRIISDTLQNKPMATLNDTLEAVRCHRERWWQEVRVKYEPATRLNGDEELFFGSLEDRVWEHFQTVWESLFGTPTSPIT